MYTEETILEYGTHKNKKIKDVPVEYLINIYKTGGSEHAELKKYIEANADKIPGVLGLVIINRKIDAPVTFICDKRTYPTKKAAMDSIVKPSSKTNKKVPIRAYECEICSGWHLTSKPDNRFI